MPNYYQLLGISPASNLEGIKTAYKKLAKKYHPDVNPSDAETIKLLNTAYEVLSDPEKRRLYDLSLKEEIKTEAEILHQKNIRKEREAKKAQQDLENKKKNRKILLRMLGVAFILVTVLSAGVWWIRANYVTPARITDLSRRSLTKVPNGLENSTIVNILYLHHNELTTLPPEIGTLPNLLELTLSHNQLETLPGELGQLKKLVRLDLSSNKLKKLPPEIGQISSLTELTLSQNPDLKTLPIKELSSLPQLKLIDVRGCSVSDEETVRLENEAPNLRILR